MTEVRFYHLQKQSLDQALPLILEKAYGANYKSLVIMQDENEAERMCSLLWTYKQNAFLPHGGKKDGNAEEQPIWISDVDENENSANALILTQGVTSNKTGEYDLVCEMLNGHSDQEISNARARWKKYQDLGYETTYWFQNEAGNWAKKA
ncbi:MAG: DNA polymerase III subunit chi [Pseudomonadota bacterium]